MRETAPGPDRRRTTMAADRTANTVWEGNLPKGNGTLSMKSSGIGGELPVTWASRTERSDGKTSPEELIAAAHASCSAMALSHEVSQAGNEPEQLTVTGRVPGIDAAAFEAAAQGAGQNCPISRLLIGGSAEITVDATLQA